MAEENNIITQKGSEYTQTSFVGGMNLLGDDTQLATNEYRVGFDLTNRYAVLDPVLQSVEDTQAPQGLKQECVTFGTYVILFVAGRAYYRLYSNQVWTEIPVFFGMLSSTAPRYWSCAVPIADTNFYRLATTSTVGSLPDTAAKILALQVAGASQGNLPGLLIQDNINQPVFIYLDVNGLPTARTTQGYYQWSLTFTDVTNVTVATNGDNREYVPIGNYMAWSNGILFIVSQDFAQINRSVSGRPLDFIVNVVNTLATNTGNISVTDPSGRVHVYPPFTQLPGGDETSTNYSVGVGGITCIKPLASGGIFVSASGANFSVTLNTNATAPTIFGEYTFIREFLFNSNCLSDRVIFDSLGDTRFIDLAGVRSFNAIQQFLNEGNNSPFSATIHGAFGPDANPIVQDSTKTAAILYNNYELYSINTIFGPCIAKYDTLNECWVSFDKQQTDGKAVKIFAKIELSILRLFAITEDDRLFTLYVGPDTTTPYFRSGGICYTIMYTSTVIKIANPRIQLKMKSARAILNGITEDATCTMTPYGDNRLAQEPVTKNIVYTEPVLTTVDLMALPDVGTQLTNLAFVTPDVSQAWKYFLCFTWTDGSFVQFSTEMTELTPIGEAETTQGVVV